MRVIELKQQALGIFLTGPPRIKPYVIENEMVKLRAEAESKRFFPQLLEHTMKLLEAKIVPD